MRILIVCHGFPPHAQGGAELYAHAHATAFGRAGDEVLVLTREADAHRPEHDVRRERRGTLDIAWINNTFARTRSFADTYTDDRIDAVAGRIIDAFRPDVAHVHHLTCLSTTILRALDRRRIPIFFTLHDYWLLCHRGQLLDLDLRPCAGPEPAGCASCIAPGAASPALFAARSWFSRAADRLPGSLIGPLRRGAARAAGAVNSPLGGQAASAARLAHMRSLVPLVRQFFAPSSYLRDRFVRFGVEPARISVSEYGWALPNGGSSPSDGGIPPEPPEQRAPRPLRLGFLGSLMVSKAPHVLLDAAARLPDGSVDVHLFGQHVAYHGDASYRADLDARLARPGVHLHGPVEHRDVRRVFAKIDALVVPSIWPENSPLVIREAFQAGVPVVASRIGGIPETVADGVNGLLFDPGDASALERALRRLIDDPGLLDRLRSGIPPVRTIDDDVTSMRRSYEAAVAKAPAARRMAAVVLNYRTPDDTFLAARSLLRSRRPIDRVIVIDNDPSGDCRAILAPLLARDPRLTYIPAGRNLGFSGGVNAGIREALAAGADRVLLVNSDVVLPVDAAAALERALDADPNAGIAGPIVLARHAPDRVGTLGMTYDRRTGRMRHRGVGAALADVPASQPPVDAVSGCCMLIARPVFDAIGLFDEDYFFGFEDLDFCLRARRARFTTILAPDAAALHEGGRSIGADSPDRLYYAARNHLLAARRASAGESRLAAAGRSVWIVCLNLAHALRARGATPLARVAAVLRGTKDYATGRFGPRPVS